MTRSVRAARRASDDIANLKFELNVAISERRFADAAEHATALATMLRMRANAASGRTSTVPP
jgi:hypothetical protein